MQQPYPPLGMLYAAAWMRDHQYNVRVFDPMFAHSADEIIDELEVPDTNYLVIYDDGFNYLTKMCLTNMREAAFQMIALAKAKGITVIINSSDSTDHAEKYLQQGADYVIYGEGEETLLELINFLDKGQTSPDHINGVIYLYHTSIESQTNFALSDEKISAQVVVDNRVQNLTESKLVKTSPRQVMKNLDQLSEPAIDLIRIEEYRKRWMESTGYFSLNISTTRGCPFHCNWCAKPIYGNRYNVHSPERVVSRIKKMMTDFGATHFWMTDDIFGLKPNWVKQFADLVEREKLKFTFKIQSRADLLTNDDTIAHLHRAGCEIVWMGAESGSQKILDAMDKGIKVEQIYEAAKGLKRIGVKPAFFLQFGYPGETKEDIRSTFKMVDELKPADIGVSVSYPLPGTVFYERVKDSLKEKANWKDSDELALMFNKELPKNYYKTLQRYIHRTFRVNQGKQGFSNLLRSPQRLQKSELRSAMLLPFHLVNKWVMAYRMNQLDNKRQS
jgi:radical SAM superfamily enzyme YgiQ (UPF0313 family)